MGQGEASKNPCDNFKDIDVTTSTPPCPQNVNQAFFDNNLEVDPGCVEDSKAPFNCYTNPGAAKCFRVLQRPSKIFSGQCCYDKGGVLLIKAPGMGLPRVKPDSSDTYLDHFRKNIWPFLLCCIAPKEPDENCKEYFLTLPKSSSKQYQQPIVGMIACWLIHLYYAHCIHCN
jgi:hypothetical protein